MSNREALRRLSRKFPTPPEVEHIMDSLRKETDTHIAILASSITEAWLEKLILSKLKSRNSNLIGQLFNNRGPLSDFHSKILVAHAFNIITPTMASEFHSLKSIRNVFAHTKIPLTFDNELIGTEIQSMKLIGAIKNAAKTKGQEFEIGNKGSYLLTIRLLLIVMEGFMSDNGTAFDALKKAIKNDI